MKLDRKKQAVAWLAAGLVGIFLCDRVLLHRAVLAIERSIRAVGKDDALQIVDRLEAQFQSFFWIAFFCASLVIGWAFWLLFREIRRRDALEKELREAQTRAERLAEARGELLSTVSHEIRSPLGAMLSFSQILSRSELDPRQIEVLEGSKMAAESLVRLANDLLDLSKMEAGKLAIESRPFRLREEVLASLEPIFQQKTAEKRLAFKIEIAPDTPEMLLGDPVRLLQILTNLLENAIKFTHSGYVFLLIEAFEEGEKGWRDFRFLIKDTGEGISREGQSLIFERFEQQPSGLRSVGAGLGLAIVRDLVELQRGSIAVESHVGFGTTFSLRLPFFCEKIAAPIKAVFEKNEAAAATALAGKKILLAEDNLLNQKLATMLLGEWGAAVETASTGAIAVELLRAAPEAFDLVLMDITMPDMDGWAATHRIRTEIKSTVPIIALTGRAQVGEREKCFAIGMDGYLAKPLREQELLDEIMFFLKGKPSKTVVLAENGPQKVLHLQYLFDLSKGKKTFVREMLDMFGKQAPLELEDIRQAVEVGDFEKIRTAAHGLKSTAAYVGMAPSGLDILDKMEKIAAEKGKPKVLRTAFLAVEKLITQAKKEAEQAVF